MLKFRQRMLEGLAFELRNFLSNLLEVLDDILKRRWSFCQRIQLKYLLYYTYISWTGFWSPHRSPSFNTVSESVLLHGGTSV